MRDDEILNIARFKLGETARRLQALAQGATEESLRAALIEVSGTLLSQQHALERRSATSKCAEVLSDVEKLASLAARRVRDEEQSP